VCVCRLAFVSFQVLSAVRSPLTHVNNSTDGGLSFVITTSLPSRSENLGGSSAGLVGRPRATGVSIRFITGTTAVVQPANWLGFPATNAPASSLVAVDDLHPHHLSVRFLAGTQELRVWIDGVLTLDQHYPLLDEGLLGPGPVFLLFVGMAASSSSSFRQDIAASVDFRFCTFDANHILPPTCVSACADTQSMQACNAPTTTNLPTCQRFGCSNNNIPFPACSNNVCVGTCDPAYQDCNLDKAIDGCETRIADDVSTLASVSDRE